MVLYLLKPRVNSSKSTSPSSLVSSPKVSFFASIRFSRRPRLPQGAWEKGSEHEKEGRWGASRSVRGLLHKLLCLLSQLPSAALNWSLAGSVDTPQDDRGVGVAGSPAPCPVRIRTHAHTRTHARTHTHTHTHTFTHTHSHTHTHRTGEAC